PRRSSATRAIRTRRICLRRCPSYTRSGGATRRERRCRRALRSRGRPPSSCTSKATTLLRPAGETTVKPEYASFAAEFLRGRAASRYQIEGETNEGGRGEGIWDRFCKIPGAVRNGESGAVACDFFHRYPGDVRLMRELGLDAFRFSVSWPRILPEGRGRVEPRGLD